MKKFLNGLIAVFLLISFYCLFPHSAYAAQYSSKNGKYIVDVKSDFSIDAKKAYYQVKDEAGEFISKFETDLSPIALIPLNNGERIIGFYGGVGQTVVITQLRFYSMRGELIGKHGIFATGSGGQDIADEGKYFAYSWRNDKKSGIDLFDTRTGKKIWGKSFKKMVNGVKLSGDGQSLLTMFGRGKIKEIHLLNNEGNLKWLGKIKTRNNCSIAYINDEGSVFEIVQSKMVYNEKDGYMHNEMVKRVIYANDDGEVKIEKTILPPKKSVGKSH
ncbi:MAG: hypothetical protein U9Q34_07305 [Elusimicrobiota bacterium]|nr:hypothetical protein [Elusimicrobiota bacterium]